jgi:hypothetical protein
MAEIFGVVAGGLSVASLAIQLTETIQRLKDFCDAVKECPGEIRVGLDEIEVLSLVLQDMEQSIRGKSFCLPAYEAAVTKSLRLCWASNNVLRALLGDISTDMAGSTRLGPLKAALRMDERREDSSISQTD